MYALRSSRSDKKSEGKSPLPPMKEGSPGSYFEKDEFTQKERRIKLEELNEKKKLSRGVTTLLKMLDFNRMQITILVCTTFQLQKPFLWFDKDDWLCSNPYLEKMWATQRYYDAVNDLPLPKERIEHAQTIEELKAKRRRKTNPSTSGKKFSVCEIVQPLVERAIESAFKKYEKACQEKDIEPMSRAVFRLEVARDLYRQMERKTDEKRAKRNFKQRQRRHRAKGKDTNGKSQQMNTLPQDKKLWTRERFNVRCRHPFGILKRSQPCQVCYLNVSQSKTLLKKYESLAARKRQQMLKKHCKYTKYFCKICKHALCMPGIKNNEDTFPSVGRSKLGCFNDFHSIE